MFYNYTTANDLYTEVSLNASLTDHSTSLKYVNIII